MHGHGAAQRFQIVAPATRGAGVDENLRMLYLQLVEIFKKSRDVFVLGNPLAVRRIGFTPEGKRRNIEVNAIDVDAVLRNEFVQVVDDPPHYLRIPQIEQPLPMLLLH